MNNIPCSAICKHNFHAASSSPCSSITMAFIKPRPRTSSTTLFGNVSKPIANKLITINNHHHHHHTITQLFAACNRIGAHVFVAQHIQRGGGDFVRERIAAVRRAVLTRLNGQHHFVVGQHCRHYINHNAHSSMHAPYVQHQQQHIPGNTPPLMALPSKTMSGRASSCSIANMYPVRPNPVCREKKNQI